MSPATNGSESHGDRCAVRLRRPDDGEADSCQANELPDTGSIQFRHKNFGHPFPMCAKNISNYLADCEIFLSLHRERDICMNKDECITLLKKYMNILKEKYGITCLFLARLQEVKTHIEGWSLYLLKLRISLWISLKISYQQ